MIGMWLILFPQLLMCLSLRTPGSIMFGLLFGVLYGTLLYRVTRNYITRKNAKENQVEDETP